MSLFQSELLDLTGDGVASNTQFLGRLNAAAFGIGQRGQDQPRLEAARQLVPHIVAARGQQAQRLGFQALLSGAAVRGGQRG